MDLSYFIPKLDSGNVIVSLALPVPGIGAIKSSFATISDWLIGALADRGVPNVHQEGVSDLAVPTGKAGDGERKIGGSCIYRTRGLLYYSTTLLVDPDLDLVDRYLPHPPREPDYRAGRDHRRFMTSLREMGHTDSAGQWAERLESRLSASLSANENFLYE
jgi:lipoate---protein ligase